MSKTISANLSQDELMQIDQYCKDNDITRSELIKKSMKNAMDAKQNKSLEDTPVDPKTIETSFIKKLVAEIDKKKELRKKIEPELKEANDTGMKKGHVLTMDHFRDKNCPKGSCEICNLKYAIQDKQRSKDEEEFKPTLQNTADRKLLLGIQYGIKARMKYPDADPNQLYTYILNHAQPKQY